MYENRAAFLTMIATAEGTAMSPATRDRGYDVVVTGIDGRPEIVTTYRWHPFAIGDDPALWRQPKAINSRGLASTAAGRYQHLRKWWLIYAKLLGLRDFSPAAQDAAATQQIRERGALPLIDGGYLEAAVRAVSGIWASLPGKQYDGQSQRTMDAVRGYYVRAGGRLNS